MPNHVHFILNINTKLDEKLGRYIARFKAMVKEKAIRKKIITADTVSIFENGFNDQFLSVKRSLQQMIIYVQENPDRWFSRWENPQFFRRIASLKIGDIECRAYGNINLLKNPFKTAVIYHRRYDQNPGEYEKLLHSWEYTIYNGGVAVGGFINKKESEFLKTAKNSDGKIIAVRYFPDNNHWKPYKELFELCEQGRLLIICPKEFDEIRKRNKWEGSREEFLLGNKLAELIERGENFSLL